MVRLNFVLSSPLQGCLCISLLYHHRGMVSVTCYSHTALQTLVILGVVCREKHCQALEQVAQGSGWVTIPGGV